MSKEQAAASIELGTLIGAACAEYETAIPEIVVDPREVPLAMERRVKKLQFSNLAREREVAALMLTSLPQITELIERRQYDELDRAVAELESRIMRLTIPERVLSVQEQANKAREIFRARSWTDEEVDGLGRWFNRSAQISEIGVSSVKVGDDLVTRAEIRSKLLCTKARLFEMEGREKEAIELEASNRERKQRGEAPYHRQWS